MLKRNPISNTKAQLKYGINLSNQSTIENQRKSLRYQSPSPANSVTRVMGMDARSSHYYFSHKK